MVGKFWSLDDNLFAKLSDSFYFLSLDLLHHFNWLNELIHEFILKKSSKRESRFWRFYLGRVKKWKFDFVRGECLRKVALLTFPSDSPMFGTRGGKNARKIRDPRFPRSNPRKKFLVHGWRIPLGNKVICHRKGGKFLLFIEFFLPLA